MAKSAQQAAQPNITFTPEQLQAYLDQAITKALEVKRAQEDHKRSDEMEAATLKAFKRAGYSDIKPRENVLTYAKWVERGFKVREGEHAIKVKNLRLFHASQVEPISKQEQTEYLAKRAAKTADRLPKPSPVQPAPVTAKGKGAAAQQPAA